VWTAQLSPGQIVDAGIARVSKARSNVRKQRAILAVVISALFAAVAFFAKEYEPPFDYGKHTAEVDRLTNLLAKEPCDRKKMVTLLKKLNQAGDYRRTLQDADGFFKKCGPLPRLLWLTFNAHMQLGEFQNAVDDASALIESDPDDPDFWWWRGKAFREMGKWEKAASDFDTCLNPKSFACPWALSKALEKLNKPCEAVAPLAYYQYHFPKKDHAKTQRRMSRLRTLGGCDVAPGGEGEVRIRFTPGQKRGVYTEGRLNLRPPGRFLVDTGASYVTIPAKDAEQYGLDVSQGRAVRVRTAAGIHTAKIVLASFFGVGPLVAQNVEVAILDTYEPGENAAGLLGLSFLNRFDLNMDSKTGTLVIRAK
jgi:clan AA aspartic protease (TIGR02281 family)